MIFVAKVIRFNYNNNYATKTTNVYHSMTILKNSDTYIQYSIIMLVFAKYIHFGNAILLKVL